VAVTMKGGSGCDFSYDHGTGLAAAKHESKIAIRQRILPNQQVSGIQRPPFQVEQAELIPAEITS
jgi:hypothetical protein